MMVTGIDVGATSVKILKVKRNSRLRKIKITQEIRSNPQNFFEELLSKFDDETFGIALPGPVKGQKLLKSPNFPELLSVDFKKLAKKLDKNIWLENDANSLAYGEYLRWKQDLVAITLGSGVGAGIVIDGKIYKGHGYGSEFGHTILFPNGRKCTCGNRGCVEMYISKKGFKIETEKEFGKEITPKQLYEMAKNGNKKAIKVFEKIGSYLGLALTNLVETFDPELIVVGGGIAQAGRFLIKPAMKTLKEKSIIPPPRIVIGKERSGAYGVAVLAKEVFG